MVVIVIVIAKMAKSVTPFSRILQVHIFIVLIEYLILFQWSNGQGVVWRVLPAALRLNHCPEIITTVPRETLTCVFSLCQIDCVWIGAIDLISEGTGVIPPPIVHLIAGFEKHLLHI
jgi:hypothetical protein